MEQDCIFCKIAAGHFGTEFVFQSAELLAFRDIHPKAPTHILIIPRQHIAYLADTSSADEPLLGRLLSAAVSIARQEGLVQSGFRLVINNGRDSGQEVPHLHLHLLGGRCLGWPPG